MQTHSSSKNKRRYEEIVPSARRFILRTTSAVSNLFFADRNNILKSFRFGFTLIQNYFSKSNAWPQFVAKLRNSAKDGLLVDTSIATTKEIRNIGSMLSGRETPL